MASLLLWIRRWAFGHVWWGVGALAIWVTFRFADLTGWDDTYYVAQLTSAVEDGDLLLQNDLLDTPRPEEASLRSVTTILESGAVQNTFGVGFAVVHGAYAWPTLALHPRRLLALRTILTFGSMALLVLTFLATSRVVARLGVSAASARLATTVALVSSPLAMYATRTYYCSHLASATLAALVMLGMLRWLEARRWQDAALTGLAAGLLVINRWQDACLLTVLLPAGFVVAGSRRTRSTLGAVVVATGAAVAGGLAQLLAWRIQFGAWFLVPQGDSYLSWTRPRLIELLFSPYHGLLPWAPGLALGLAALALRPAATALRGLRLGLILATILTLYVSALPHDWWGGNSYGPRRLSSLVPLAAIGLGLLFDRLPRIPRVALACGALAWTVFTVSLYFSGVDDLSRAAEVHWRDRWGWLHSLKPGFSLSDAPTRVDKIAGAMLVALVVVTVGVAWALLRRSSLLRTAAVALGLAWVLFCDGWLALAVPVNDPWNPRWRAVVRGQSEVGYPPFPPSVEVAAQTVRDARTRVPTP
jgi:hypothetical protein